MATMQQSAAPIKVSHDLYLAILRENPDLRLEHSKIGELIVVPPAGGETGAANAELTGQLRDWNRRHHAGMVFDSSTGFRLPDGATRSPDVAWVEQSRWSQLTPSQRRAFPPLCPDFVAEMLSPSDNLDETRAKMHEYLENGARLGWLIDPFRKTLEIYRPGEKAEICAEADVIDGDEVLAGFTVDLGPIFGG